MFSKFWLMTAKASRNRSFVVLSILRMASPVEAIASTRSFFCARQEGVPGLEIVELIDGHHVDGAHAHRFSCAGRSPSRRASCCERRGQVLLQASRSARRNVLVDFRGVRTIVDRPGACQQPIALERIDFGRHFIERRLHGLHAGGCEVRQSRPLRSPARPRAATASARTPSSVRRASRMRPSCSSNPVRKRG